MPAIQSVNRQPLSSISPAEPLSASRTRKEQPPDVARPAGAAPGSAASRPQDSTGTGSVRRLFVELERQRQDVDQAIRQAASGRSFSPSEICALQARVYVYAESLEVVSHLLDRAVSAVKTTLSTQV